MQWVIDGVKKAKNIDKIVIASPHEIPGFKVFIPSKGTPEADVLSRYYQCAKKYKADIVVRVTADCPLIDGAWIDLCLRYLEMFNYDYVCNTPFCPDGLDVEVFTMRSLKKANEKATQAYDREHVTPYIRNNFKMGEITDNYHHYQNVKISVDTKEDLERVRRIANGL